MKFRNAWPRRALNFFHLERDLENKSMALMDFSQMKKYSLSIAWLLRKTNK